MTEEREMNHQSDIMKIWMRVDQLFLFCLPFQIIAIFVLGYTFWGDELWLLRIVPYLLILAFFDWFCLSLFWDMTSRSFRSPLKTSAKLIGKALEKQGISFRKLGAGEKDPKPGREVFQLLESPRYIRVQPFLGASKSRCWVGIGPCSEANRKEIENLKKLVEEAFRMAEQGTEAKIEEVST